MSTNKKQYFKHWAESDLGQGNVYIEAVGDVIVRQVEVYRSVTTWADKHGQSDERFLLADQPLSWFDLDSDDGITATEFEAAWKKAKAATGGL
ncbi:hypothetical protein [Stenotrophomonas sp. HMWF003]|jgi:hypothetical protein|uniref:hypothetical protein n=1 Tax=unclassified Stenotrophomonas TaxID=196198 RepID=UPI000D4126C7|nr:hypothetical protein [Stenotrophomonas sp. HMWF003]PTT64704.1 hypothetical protein DBR34_04050 [Stenotrophomonas sp. HMWF003]